MFCALGMAQAQPTQAVTHMNVPATVCMSLTNSTTDQAKFTSVNSYLDGNGISNISLPTWVIQTPGGTDADYNILYSAVASPVKSARLVLTKSLTLEFLVPGTYTFTATYSYRENNTNKTISISKTLTAVDCTIKVCNGGNAVMAGFNENFGSIPAGAGGNRMPYPVAGVVQYKYETNPAQELRDDWYVLGLTTQQKGDWVNSPDHTGNSRGAMLVANSTANPLQFYEKKVTGLCSGAVYNFSAWLMNINTKDVFENGCISDYKYAGVTFQVVDANNPSVILANFKTYDVSMNLAAANGTWQRYGGQFTILPGVTDVLVRIINDKPGGCGNDIAIDDISFTYCSPIITAGLKGNGGVFQEVLCEGTPDTLTSSILPAGYFTNPVYQWEMSDNNGASWFNVPFGTTRDSLLKIPEGELKGTKTVAAIPFPRSCI